MFEGKRQSFGTATHYLNGHSLTMKRYLQTFYPPYDWKGITWHFYDNSVQAKVILEDFQKDNDYKIEEVFRLFHQTEGTLLYVIGAKGSGKTCTGFYFAEYEHINYKYTKIFYIGRKFDSKILPAWCGWKEKLQDVPNGSFGIIDEVGIQASARAFQSKDNKELSQVLQLARQQEIRLIVLTQDTRLGEVNVWRMKDIIIWKKSNTYSLKDREGSKDPSNKFWGVVRNMMAPKSKAECLFEYPAERRFIHFTHEPPECWNEELSKIYKDAKFNDVRESEKVDRGKFLQTKVKNKNIPIIIKQGRVR